MATHRTSIVKTFVELLKTALDGSQPDIYYTNIYNNVSDKILHFDQVKDFPFVSVAKGQEDTEYHPAGFRWNYLTVYLRVYVRGADDYDEQLETLLTDLKTFIDLQESFDYNVTMPSGTDSQHKVTEITVLGTDTDEGLLAPDAFGEIQLRVRYEDCDARLRV